MTEQEVNDIKEMVSQALSKTITTLRRIYNDGKGIDTQFQGSRLIFPSYGNEEVTRISEQELRFVFAEKLSYICKKGKKYYYSVETPTKEPYKFSDGPSKIDPLIGVGQSGNFDMVVHDKERKKVCLIEFKSGKSVSKQAFMEVLAKLANPKEIEVDSPRYIIHMVEDERSEACLNNLEEAKRWLKLADGMLHPIKEVSYLCFCLMKRKRVIKERVSENTINDKKE